MELTKLYEVQAELKKHIGYKGKDKFSKMMLAMLVEFMECANDWRGFKYWSENPQPKETLLEEYVDGFHFVLETGLDLKEHTCIMMLPKEVELTEGIHDNSEHRIVKQYKILIGKVLELEIEVHNGVDYMDESYEDFIYRYLLLGKLLGFTEEEIEQAYFKKNEVNHQRQDNGY
ncbi:dUTPase [Bacillus pseudomycoides]|uniref:dUTP diphosphatase n=1 Tax=Bacillus pseudomycoides TaxID=64104 RepID=UPI000BFD9327|nr:dUTP diphosphatase [Bacillus pseudomycoides]PHB24760.1 dUTPase [Bacillus pseudomycoides]